MFLDDIGTYLASKGIGVMDTTIFRGDMPDKPDTCITLSEYAGDPPEIIGEIEHPGLQVRVRSKSYVTARNKLKDIEDELHTLANQILSGTKYLSIFAVQSAVPLGRDSQGRTKIVQNYIVTKGR